jgi:hypothetical protein
VNTSIALERGYLRWLRCYPRSYRRDHQAEILAVLMADAAPTRRRPDLRECLRLVHGAVRLRLRPTVPRSDRLTFTAIRLMYVGAALQLAVAVTVATTMGEIRSRVATRHVYTSGEWHTEVAGALRPLVIAALVEVAIWLTIAWAHGRRQRWTSAAVAVLLLLTTESLLHGLQQGSATYASADLAAGIALWLVELATAVVVLGAGIKRLIRRRSETA